MDPRQQFSDADLASIAAATAAAERRTSGEIVTYIVGQCDPYTELGWVGAALGALAGAALASLLHGLGGWWGVGVLWLVMPTFVGAALGLLLAVRVAGIGRRLVSPETLAHRARLRAEAAFLEEGVFKTRERTGILLFLALFEHQAIVLGDEGINAAVEPGAWQGIVDGMVAGMRAGRAADALREAVAQCGALLDAHSVVRRSDDSDELPDAPRLHDR